MPRPTPSQLQCQLQPSSLPPYVSPTPSSFSPTHPQSCQTTPRLRPLQSPPPLDLPFRVTASVLSGQRITNNFCHPHFFYHFHFPGNRVFNVVLFSVFILYTSVLTLGESCYPSFTFISLQVLRSGMSSLRVSRSWRPSHQSGFVARTLSHTPSLWRPAFPWTSKSLSLSLTHTHTHTHSSSVSLYLDMLCCRCTQQRRWCYWAECLRP